MSEPVVVFRTWSDIEATLGGFVAEELIYRDPREGKMFLGLGEIPFTHVYPEIWIDDDRDALVRFLSEFVRARSPNPPSRYSSARTGRASRR